MASRKDSRNRVLKQNESQRANGTYEYRYKDPISGKRVSIYRPTLAELREAEKEIQKMLDTQIDILRGNRTLEDQVDLFLKTKSVRLREGSRKTYATAANTIRSSSLAKTKIQKLTTSSIKRLFISLYEQDMSKNYINLVHIVLKNSLQMAFEDGCLVKNPCAFKLSSVLPEIKSSPPVALKKQEKDNLLLMLEKSKNPKDKFYFHVVRILCETGLRIGEFRGLRPSAISFEDTEISIHHQLSRQGTYDVPKTEHAIRKVPLTDNAATSLRYLVDRAEKIRQKTGSLEYAGCSDFIAISEKGIPVDYFAYARAFVRFEKEYQEKYGEPIEVTPHICRHTFSSNCVAGGLPHKSLQQLMGHSNFQMTMNVYTNLEDSVVREDFFRAASAL